jgi:choline kinase
MSVRAIILAAGFGSRLMPYTADRPKGMVELGGIPMLKRQIDVLRKTGVENLLMVGGYHIDQIAKLGFRVVNNQRYETTNMVSSLMCAREYLDGAEDTIIAYSDIVYETKVLNSLLETSGDFVVVADKKWRDLWDARMEAPLDDAESFKVNGEGNICQIGRKAATYADIEGQYIGLMKIPAARQKAFLDFYDSLDPQETYEGKSYDTMYLTALIQRLIDTGWAVAPAWIENGWLEVDAVEDLKRYQSLLKKGALAPLCDLEKAGGNASKIEATFPGLDDFIRARIANSLPDPAAPGVNLGKLFSDIWEGATPSCDELGALDKIARKIEIAGTVYACYDQDNFKPVTANGLLPVSGIEAMLGIYLMVFTLTGDARHLNTVLKAIGGVLRLPADGALDPRLNEWADAALDLVPGFLGAHDARN